MHPLIKPNVYKVRIVEISNKIHPWLKSEIDEVKRVQAKAGRTKNSETDSCTA
jgi:hypothetical protein